MTLMHSQRATRRLVPWFNKALLLMAGISFLGLGTPARAAERVILRFEETERTVPLANIESFIETGTPVSQDLQEFVDRHPDAGRIIRDILNAEIYISPSFVAQIRQGLASSTGEFVLIQLSKLVSDASVPDDLQPLETAVINAFENDNRLSLVEVLREYPRPEIRLNLTGLETTYNTVRGFVERVLPALEVAREYLQDLICDCPTPAATDTPTTSPQSRLPGAAIPVAAGAANCQDLPLADSQPGATATAAAAPLMPAAAETDALPTEPQRQGNSL
ncbi:MAG: alpha/beta hydrolase [Synechococcales cyanobacterium M58_A2018_015]|nr:alpha/beta hydrolase [Synechococcales cyanobacterium M58_A2018_015]